MDYNFVDIVAELESMAWLVNEKFIENYGNMFIYTTNGAFDIIECCGVEVFNSETIDWDLCYNEDKDEYISQLDLVKFILNESIKKINDIHKTLAMMNKGDTNENN